MHSPNDQIDRARQYHDRTAHSPRSIRESRHTLDWNIKPSPFKIYPTLPALPLPRDFPAATADTFASLSGSVRTGSPLDIERLAALLFYSAGITRARTYPGGDQIFFRAAPSTGALYQTEVYVVAGDVSGLPAGVYHFGPGDFALRALRAGDFRGAVAWAAGDDRMATAPAVAVLTAIYWRNTWKYQSRGYRHLFWDAGAMLANLLAAATALGLPARVVTGFVDAEVDALLGLDAAKEGALAVVPIGADARPATPPPPLLPVSAEIVPLSSAEVQYPLLVEARLDSSLDSEAAVLEWRERRIAARPAAPTGPVSPLPAPRAESGRSLGETLQARGSTREFSGAAISAEELSSALHHATRGIDGDVQSGLVDLYLTVHAVGGIAPGAYRYDRRGHGLELIKPGDFRSESAFLCLEQPLGGMSSATVFFLSDLSRLLGALGNRGYRVANLEAGIVGGRLYVAAYAQRFGATGLTFYDRSVVEFFAPPAADLDAMFVTALGRSVKATPRTAASWR